jgi:hypothetical protein
MSSLIAGCETWNSLLTMSATTSTFEVKVLVIQHKSPFVCEKNVIPENGPETSVYHDKHVLLISRDPNSDSQLAPACPQQ